MPDDEPPTEVLTIGHSTRSLEELVELLRANEVTVLVDIRTVPRSRHNPQFNRESLPTPLTEAGIEYRHMGGLGGLRKAKPDSRNTAWRNESFRGFADYMETSDFETALDYLIALAGEGRTAIMCAEAVPWRCHRAMISDALVAHGVRVSHVVGTGRTQLHEPTGWARVIDGRVSYAPPLL